MMSEIFTTCGVRNKAAGGIKPAFWSMICHPAVHHDTFGSGYNDISHNDIPFITISSRAFNYFWYSIMIFTL